MQYILSEKEFQDLHANSMSPADIKERQKRLAVALAGYFDALAQMLSRLNTGEIEKVDAAALELAKHESLKNLDESCYTDPELRKILWTRNSKFWTEDPCVFPERLSKKK